jgi:hypothetical protein
VECLLLIPHKEPSSIFQELGAADHSTIIHSTKDQHMEFKQYRRKGLSEMRPFVEGEVLPTSVSISEADKTAGSPKIGDMIARNPKNHDDQWLVAAKYFQENMEPA